MSDPTIKALLFDVFGTVVDWRSSIIREGENFGRSHNIAGVDWTGFADAWRGLYQPTLEKVRSGAMPWQVLDDLHRMSLDKLLAEHGIAGLAPAAIDHFNRAWHRLDPWPDVVPGLERLKRAYIVATCSNGNVALMVNLAKFGGLPWDMILGAEPARAYKPLPAAYLKSVEMLRLAPAQCVMVAAHKSDLEAAAACGLKTAYIARPFEYGKAPAKPPAAPGDKPARPFDFNARDMVDLASQLGC